MFFKKSSPDEFFTEVKENLYKLQSSDEARAKTYTDKIITYLKQASSILKNANFNDEAEIVDDVCDNTDPAIAGADTAAKQVKNLKEFGTILYMSDNDDEVIV